MTKSLTEQWKDGTLETGCYYVLSTEDDTPVACDIDVVDDFMIREVLAPVPSYDEVKEMSQKIERLEFDNEALEMAHNEGKEINAELVQKMHILEKQLAIATKALKKMAKDNFQCAEQALEEIELRR